MKLKQIITNTIFLTLYLGQATNGLTQVKYKITGEIFNEDQTPLFQGNIVVYNSTDSTFITGALIKDGQFDLPLITLPQVIIKIVSIEHLAEYININKKTNEDSILIGQITLQPNTMLNEVVVTDYVPLFEAEGTATIVNVDNTILATSTSPLEILSKLPGVLVKNGEVSLLGKGQVAIFMDGQRITGQQLDNIPVNQIIKFEIIKDPSARYDGDVIAVIKVITRQFHYEGTNVNIRSSVTLPYFMSNSAVGFNYRKKKWTIKTNYSLTFGETWNYTENSAQKADLFNTDIVIDENANVNRQTINTGISYQIDSLSSTAIEYSNNLSNIGVDVFSQNRVTSTQISNYYAKINGSIKQVNHNFIANYNRRLDTSGSNIFIGSQYTDYQFSMDELVNEDISINNVFFNTQQRQIQSTNRINIISAQADYEKYFSNTSIGIGTKYSNAKTVGDLSMANQINDAWVNLASFTSNTLFTENIFAAYVTFKTQVKTFTFSGGLRFEHTDAFGETTQQDQLNLSRTYDWFLPSLLINKKLNKKLGIDVSLSYNTSIGRPSYNDLNPKVIYIDSLTSKQGNPLLLPQRDHSITAAFNLGPLRFDATYYHSFNAFKNVVKEGLTDENSITLYRENVQADRLYATATLPIGNKKNINNYIYYLVGWDKILGEQANFSQYDLAPTHYLYFFSSIKVKDYFNMELIANYSSGRYDGIYKDISTYTVSAGVSKSFFNHNLKCSLFANDIFFSQRDAGTFYYEDYSLNYLIKSSSRFIRFSINYKFGRLKHNNYKTISVGQEENQRIK
jgi:hypothetical protein